MTARHFLSILFIILVIFTSSCQRTAAEEPTPVPTPRPETFSPGCLGQEAAGGLRVETGAGVYEGWQRYTHQAYGFTLAIPADWELVEGEHFLCARPQAEPEVVMTIGVRQEGEEAEITGAEFEGLNPIPTRQVSFLNQVVFRHEVTVQGNDKAVLYLTEMQERVIPIDTLEFSISLEDFRSEEGVDLSNETKNQADLILQSFLLTR